MNLQEEQDVGSIEITETEVEQKPEVRHFIHPTDPAIRWCGAFGNVGKYINGNRPTPTNAITCPLCLDLYNRMGGDWWWDTHRKFFQSECHTHNGIQFHNCPYS